MALIIGTILALFSLGVAVYPFLRRRRAGSAQADRDGLPAAGAGGAAAAGPDSVDSVYDAIRTLQLERELGNIPEGLYREQLDDYRRQAALALRQQAMAQVQATAEAPDTEPDNEPDAEEDAALEEEIRLARAGLGAASPEPEPAPEPPPEPTPEPQSPPEIDRQGKD